METGLSLIGLVIVAIIAWVVLKFVLKLTARVVGCAVSALVVLGFVFIIYWFFIR